MTTHDSPTQSTQSPEGFEPARTEDPIEQSASSTVSADPSAPSETATDLGRHSADETDATHGQAPQTVARSEPSVASAQSAIADAETPAEVTRGSGKVGESPTEAALFADDELAGLRARWDSVQAAFVDDPKECVHKADGLVSDLVDQLTTSFAEARSRLEEHWARGEQASTEDLRLALKRYRDFFERLLAV